MLRRLMKKEDNFFLLKLKLSIIINFFEKKLKKEYILSFNF